MVTVAESTSPLREEDGTLYRPDESFERCVSPVEALDLLPERKRKHVLQNRAHYALGDYLRGGDPHSLDIAASLTTEYGVDSDPNDALDVITSYYAHETEILPPGDDRRTLDPKRFDGAEYGSNDLEREVRRLAAAVNELDDYLSSAFLHGSFGDREYVRNYSDVDLLLVVSMETATDAAALAELQKKLSTLRRHYYYVDPHQHHGPMIVAEQDLRAYNRAYLPPIALSRGRSLINDDPTTVRIRDDELERKHGFWRVLQTLRRTVYDGRFPSTFDGDSLTVDQEGPLYCLKHFTSIVMLLPSLYATAVGDPVYKSRSFSLSAVTEGEPTAIVDRCSAVRAAYPTQVSFDRGDAYRTALRSDPEKARRRLQSRSVPEELWSTLGKGYFDAALRAGEYLWTRTQ